MATPQQFLGSFLRQKAAAYADANVRLLPIYTQYFGEPLSKHARDFMLHDAAEVEFEDVNQSGDSARVITRQHFRSGDIRTRYHLAAAAESWRIVQIDRACFFCFGTGRSGDSPCERCAG